MLSAYIASFVTVLAFIPYLRSILRSDTTPHVFSWVVFGLSTFMAFLAQLADGGGIGAWPIGISGMISLCVAVLAYLRRGDISIDRTDWACFLMALSSILIWMIAKDPFWVSLIVSITDTFGMIPTIRKLYHHPYSESLLFYNLIAFRNCLAIVALETYSATTLLFPISLTVTLSVLLSVALIMRRRNQKT